MAITGSATITLIVNNKSGACPHCKEGYIPPNTKTPKKCDVCEQPVENCPKKNCNGYLQQENGPHGPFWGCSQFRVTGCDYKAKIGYSSTKVTQTPSEKSRARQNYSPSNAKIDELRETYPNAYKPWTEQQENQLRELVKAKKNDVEISEIMGRQVSAVRSKKEKLEL